jgi:arabinose-5-phosphate isomerase
VSRATAVRVIEIEARAILDLRTRIDASFDRAVELLHACRGRVIVTGMGKSGLIGEKISATLSSTGSPSLFLHPAEAVHGDIGRIVSGDVVVAISYGGETEEILRLLPLVKRLGCPLVALTGNQRSTLAGLADVPLDISVEQEACPLGLAPTASTAATLAMGDALAMALLERRGFTEQDFADLHPAGTLGAKLLRVEDRMHAGDQLPLVPPTLPMREVLFEMTRKRLGVTTVADDERRLLGIISDGDLRRHMERFGYTLLDQTAAECMTRDPVVISRRELATRALDLMEQRKITCLVVVDAQGVIEGLLHLHDLWKTELI